MTPRIRPLATVRQCQISEPTLRHLISSLEEQADALAVVIAQIRPQLNDGRAMQLSRLDHVLGHLEGYADGLRYYLPKR